MRIKLDENLGVRTADVFRAAGHGVATVAEQGVEGASDSDLFAICVRERRALVSLDLDFANPLRFDPSGTAGIAVLRVPDLPGRSDVLAAAMRLVAALQEAEIAGRLWIVGTARVRQYDPGDLR